MPLSLVFVTTKALATVIGLDSPELFPKLEPIVTSVASAVRIVVPTETPTGISNEKFVAPPGPISRVCVVGKRVWAWLFGAVLVKMSSS